MSQYTEVKRICDDLERSGKAVSLDYVLSKVSDAQASVVSHYKKWRNEQLQGQSPDQLPGFSDDFIQAFRQEALKQTQQQTALLTRQLAEAIQAEVKAVEQLQYQQHSLQQLALHKAELEQNLATQQQQLARQADTFAELTTERDHLQQEVQQLQGQLTTQQHHLQQSQQAQAQLTQLQQDLTKLQQAAAQQQADDRQRLQQLTEQYELLRKRSAEQQRQHFENNQQVHRQLADYAAQCAELTSERDALQTQLTTPNLLTSEAQVITADANNSSEQAYTALQQDYAAQASYIAELKQQIALLTITPHSDTESADSGQLTDLVAERDQAIAAAAAHAHEVQELKQELQRLNALIQAPDTDNCNDIAQLRTTIALLRHQSALTANHQAEQRELIKQLRDELAQQREQVQKIQVERYQWAKQKLQLEEQVNFVKNNSAATIERLTRYREQAQERIEQLEQKLRAS